MTRDKGFQLGLLGWPLGHSISPTLLNAALLEAGFSGKYQLFPVPPLPEGSEQLREIIARMRSGELLGLNVTIPHKQVIIPFLDDLTDMARAIGAVNLIFHQENRLIGDNSDSPAFQEDLYRFLSNGVGKQSLIWIDENKTKSEESAGPPATALVLGAGGAARAVVYTLLQEGWQIIVAARRHAAAMQLTRDFEKQITGGAGQLMAITLEHDSLSEITQCHLIVNATPLGTISGEESSPWPLDLPFPPGTVIYDLVYNPPETLLVRAARNAGLVATCGLGMLVEQAALAFERWTQSPAPRSEMYSAARNALGLDTI
jgi:shikimate dehydrogenase